MARRRQLSVIGLSFLDAITCGFGAVILFYMIISSSVGQRAERHTHDLSGEVDRLEEQVLDEYKELVRLRNAVVETEREVVTTRGLSRRVIDTVEKLEVELATFDESSLSRREHINQLQVDLKQLDEEAKRLAANVVTDETPGIDRRSFVGDGDRQYLTGLKVGGRRILILVDASASMLDETVVNVIRRRNQSDDKKRAAPKWKQTVATVDWLMTQLPEQSQFQLYTFAEDATPLVPNTAGSWLDAGDVKQLDDAVERLRAVAPQRGTSLFNAFAAVKTMRPPPDNLILVTDGLPTQGQRRGNKSTVNSKERVNLYRDALGVLPGGFPVNVILLPMEGDPMAASLFWKLAIATSGSCMSPSEGWP